MQKSTPLILGLVVAGVTGCSSTGIRQTDKEIDADRLGSLAMLQAARNHASDRPAVRVMNDEFAPPAPRPVAAGRTALPFPCSMRIPGGMSMSLSAFAQQVTKDCKIRVRITPDAIAHVSGVNGSNAQAGQESKTSGALPPMSFAGLSLPPPIGATGSQVNLFGGEAANRLDLEFPYGPVESLLDLATARLGLYWRYGGDAITIHYLDSRTFKLYNVPSTTDMTSTVVSGVQSSVGVSSSSSGGNGSSGGGVSGASGSSQVTTVKQNTTPLDDLKSQIVPLLTPGVSRVALTDGAGPMLTVTDTPAVLDQLASFVESYNRSAAMQAIFDVKILLFRSNRSDEASVNWDLAYKSLAGQYSLGLSNAFQSSDGAVQGNWTILDGDSRFSGSQAIIKALSQQGNVQVVKQPTVTALNYEAIPVQVADQTTYVAQVRQTVTSDVGVSTSAEPGTVTVGFNMHLRPEIKEDGKTVLLSFSINQAELKTLDYEEVGDTRLGLPQVGMTIFRQKTRIMDGQTLVVSGFETNSKSTTRSGVGSPRFSLFGGGGRSERTKEAFIVLITPHVDSP
ncbi:PilN family type IVB pilus formation outer membrane protein (plasmid) [Xanthomonas campestris pv. campestris]|uniref:PilN family type IVB pilus formation outer membrane protein n=1 Tax=Xanthomonas TaxID=338 RepID=UPI000CEE62CE|nr:PilN family type IVB pilus formation outer membrane protein [Xanthomonas arboricola]PPU05581.1 PilN family type IVB pilus formation outer membrane protein [Xanthomonas arboricola]WDJ74915.1 PilN family type IVB pilus formation outer membrane protein [Xanthomonas campestris pv. campestris]